MATKTRIKLLRAARSFYLVAVIIIVFLATQAYQSSAATGSVEQVSAASLMLQVITGLLALLQTLFLGIGVWLISNQTELFRRLGAVETAVNVREELCDERHNHGK